MRLLWALSDTKPTGSGGATRMVKHDGGDCGVKSVNLMSPQLGISVEERLRDVRRR